MHRFVLEVIRYLPLVGSVPYCRKMSTKTDDEKIERRLIHLASALKDPRVWGEGADSFRLRDLDEYSKLSVAWAEPMVDLENNVNSKNCPAKELSIAMVAEFVKAFLERRNKFASPNILFQDAITGEWEIHVEVTS